METIDVPRNDFTEQAKIAQAAAEGKLSLVWNAKRQVIQARAPLRVLALPAGFERRREGMR